MRTQGTDATMIEVTLPLPPSVNHYYRRVGYRTLISREGRAYRQRVCSILADMGAPCLAGPLAVELEFFRPDNRKRDLDNLLKALFDAMQHGGLYADDCEIVKKTIWWADGEVPGGAVIVRVQKV